MWKMNSHLLLVSVNAELEIWQRCSSYLTQVLVLGACPPWEEPQLTGEWA